LKKKGKSISLTVALAPLLPVHSSEVSGGFLAMKAHASGSNYGSMGRG
jgi:hypothetical protein